MDPDDRLLRYFLVVAEELNFTRAAERLHIAQPSLSAQIRQLEKQLGTRLLQRSTRAVSLTEAGQALYARGPRALASLARAWQAARDAGRGVVGTLRLAYTLSAGHDTVPRLIEAVHDAYPGIGITTSVLPSPQVLLAVRDHDADAGVARTPASVDGVRLRPLRHDQAGILVDSRHPLASADTVDLRTVVGYPVVLHSRSANPGHYDFIRQLFASRGLRPTYLERDIAFDLSHRDLSDGNAASVVGRSTALHLPADLRWIPLSEPVAITVTLALPADDPSPTAQRLEETALALAAGHRWLA